MSLLTYQYDPVGTANVLINAMHVGQQRQAQQQSMLAELAKQISTNRQHAVEFDRVQAFEQAKLEAEQGRESDRVANQLRDETENRRRYDLENAPYSGLGGDNPTAPAPPSATATPAASGFGSSPEIGSEGIPADALAASPGAAADFSLPDTMPAPDAAAVAASDVEAENIARARAKAAGLQTPAGRAATRSLPLDQGALPTGRGTAPASVDLMGDATSKLEELGAMLAKTGVGAKKARETMADAAKNLIAPYRSGQAAPKVKSAFIDPETGEIHTMFTNGEWNTPPPDARRLAELKDVNDPRVKLSIEKEKRIAEDADAKAKLEREKFDASKEDKTATAATKSAAEKAKALQAERVNLRTLMGHRDAIKPSGEIKNGGPVYTPDEKAKADAADKEINGARERIRAMGGDPNSNEPPTLTSKAEFDALPSGAEYIRDGTRYRKP